MKLLILLSFILASCAHPGPRGWWPSDHIDMMAECRAMCKNKVKSYTPYDGECVCKGE